MRRLAVTAIVAVGAVAVVLVASAALAQGDGRQFRAALDGYQEVEGAPGPDTGSVSTTGRGRMQLRVQGNTLRYRLTYSRMEGNVTAAHIHFAERFVGGGVIAFLCGGGDKPACPSPGGTVQGVIDAADVIGPAGQGIEPGAIQEVIRALRAGAVYANVHSSKWPEGEIRGQLGRGERRARGGDDD